MLECPNCKTPYQPGNHYCRQCGTRLSQGRELNGNAVTRKSLNLVKVQYDLGLVYFKKGQYQEALETWEKALIRDPRNELVQECIAEVKALLLERN